jgi:putative tryptophan/tyrosine transport system substrate-binding protein
MTRATRGLQHHHGACVQLDRRAPRPCLTQQRAPALPQGGSLLDVIVARGLRAAQAAKRATQTIPIVMVGVGVDPVEAGLVASLAQPGGNLTGLIGLGVELSGKRLELLKELVSQLVPVAVLWDGTNPGNVQEWRQVRAAQHAITTIPIVMALSGDPAGAGFVASLARPGGNMWIAS